MRIVIVTLIATLCVGCASIFGGYGGEFSTQAGSTASPGASFAVVNASGAGKQNPALEESITRGLEQLGFVVATDSSSAQIIAEYSFSVSKPKIRFRNLSHGFNNTNEMYTQTVYTKTLAMSVHSLDSQLIWEGSLSSEDSNDDIGTLADIYVGQLLSHFGQTVTDEDWFMPRFASDNILAKIY